MNNSFTNKKSSNIKSERLDWGVIQTEMKNKLGVDIYESWLKKILFVEEEVLTFALTRYLSINSNDPISPP